MLKAIKMFLWYRGDFAGKMLQRELRSRRRFLHPWWRFLHPWCSFSGENAAPAVAAPLEAKARRARLGPNGLFLLHRHKGDKPLFSLSLIAI